MMVCRCLLMFVVGWLMLEMIGRIVSVGLCSFGMMYRVPGLLLLFGLSLLYIVVDMCLFLCRL